MSSTRILWAAKSIPQFRKLATFMQKEGETMQRLVKGLFLVGLFGILIGLAAILVHLNEVDKRLAVLEDPRRKALMIPTLLLAVRPGGEMMREVEERVKDGWLIVDFQIFNNNSLEGLDMLQQFKQRLVSAVGRPIPSVSRYDTVVGSFEPSIKGTIFVVLARESPTVRLRGNVFPSDIQKMRSDGFVPAGILVFWSGREDPKFDLHDIKDEVQIKSLPSRIVRVDLDYRKTFLVFIADELTKRR